MRRKLIPMLLGLTLTFGMTAGASDIDAADAKAPAESTVTADAPAQDTAGSGAAADAPPEEKLEAVAGAVTCPFNMTPAAQNTYPYMGASIELPELLLNAVLDNEVFMRTDEDVEYTDLGDSNCVPMDWRPSAEHTVLHGGGIEFLFVPEEIRERTPHMGMADLMTYDEFEVWSKDTVPLARFDMYLKTEFDASILEDDGYTVHDKVGENEMFVYYLSHNVPSDHLTQEEQELCAALGELKNDISIFEAKPVDDTYFGITTPDVKQSGRVGSFQTETLNGQAMDETFFSGKKLTMINAWTTWCGACIEEMPDLEKLSQNLENSDVQIMSIVCDTADARGEVDPELLALAQQITKRTEVTFPCLIPDVSLQEGLLQGILGYPTTWFVDEQGNVIGDPVLGSNTTEDWMTIIQERLEEAGA